MQRSGKLLVLNLLTGGIFTPQGQLVALIHVKLGMAEGHMGLLGLAKFLANRFTWVGIRPKMAKISTFGKELPYRSEPFYQFILLLGAFTRLTTLH